MKVLNVNCQSILNKKEKFQYLVESTGADIVLGTESWLHNNIKDREVFPDNYIVKRKDRKIGRGGGMFIAVRDDFVSAHMADFETDYEIIWVKLEINSCKTVYLASYYRPNVNHQESLSHLAESLKQTAKKQ